MPEAQDAQEVQDLASGDDGEEERGGQVAGVEHPGGPPGQRQDGDGEQAPEPPLVAGRVRWGIRRPVGQLW